MRVLVSPSYGSSGAQRHWADTIDQEVPFAEPRYDELLTPEQRERLAALHPEKKARFWGARARHEKKMADVTTGDIVLFTGRNQVLAVGEVGAVFRNGALADRLWKPESHEKSWHIVYSLLDFAPSDISYLELNAAIGYKSNHVFPGQLVLRDHQARSVLEEFMITPGTAWSPATTAPEPSEPSEHPSLSSSRIPIPSPVTNSTPALPARDPVRIAAAEEVRTHRTTYERAHGLIVVERHESRLVSEFRQHLIAQGRTPIRFYCPSGISDIYVSDTKGTELIEAKSKPTRLHTRQALSQLLDYAPHSPRPVERLGALFPLEPARADVELLHRYGIDVIHREPTSGFRRLPASLERRERMRELWSA
ncbi:hypothetical protein [Streptomyces paludis]|uniref:EVE domain-containing protein n=1 Tax=Streptomyces paludis TaxID=2282738 RepID=A0A345HU93_9ACTN|nr:hypothetical protein [Streptomyces paludis]AXG80267.1 hypothetical protein DVK44_24325 [Streptomyces paludis]